MIRIPPPEFVTSEMRATCREAHDALIDGMETVRRLEAETLRQRLALSAALPLLEKHGEYRTASLIRCAVGDCDPVTLCLTGPVLIVDNGRRA